MGGILDQSPLLLAAQVEVPEEAVEALAEATESAMTLFARHQASDWGELCDEDWQANVDSIKEGGRLFSAYILSTGVKVWLITEADRSASTILLPDEY